MTHTIMARILNNRFYDSYFKNLLDLESDFPSCEFFYEPIGITWINQLDFNNNKTKVIITTDFLTNADVHDRFSNVLETMRLFPHGKVLVCAPVYNAHLDYDLPNVHFVCCGADFCYQLDKYNKLPTFKKTFKEDFHWSYTSYIPRTHRLTAGCWLAGKNYANGFCKVNFGIHNNPSWSNYYHLPHDLTTQEIKTLDQGWRNLTSGNYNKLDAIEGYNVPPNNNHLNFTLNLQEQYESLAVEIVSETTFRQHGIHVTEKFLHTVYGAVFPILIAPTGSVSYLESLGFDLFRDIVDHSYDNETDPERRMISAIESNSRLLSDKQYALEHWHANKDRFINNLATSKNIDQICRSNFVASLNAILL